MSRTARDEVVLRFRPLRGAVPLPQRVRALLKYALRSCNLRCVAVENLPAENVPAPTHQATQDAAEPVEAAGGPVETAEAP